MPNWNGIILTNKGRQLQAKVEAGTVLTITKLKLGDGEISGSQTLEGLTDLVSPKQNLGIAEKEVMPNGLCRLGAVISNTGLTTGYYVKELGIYATDPDEGEILYAITTCTAPDYLPAGGGATVVSEEFDVNIAVANGTSITATLDPNALATMGYVNNKISEHTHDAIAKHNDNADAHAAVRDLLDSMTGYRMKSTAYTLGARVGCHYHRDLELFCTQAGTTAAIALDTKNAAYGNVITDGSVKWTVVRKDGHLIGDVVPRPFLELGYVKANGATVNRADYPTLVAFATANNLWTDTPATEPWKFGKGNGSTTMVLPDYRNRVIQGGDNAAVLAAGLPNIMGKASGGTCESFSEGTGALTGTRKIASSGRAAGGGGGSFAINFDASQSNKLYGASDTVQPPAIALVAQIKC